MYVIENGVLPFNWPVLIWPVLIWPVLVLVFVAFFFITYRRDMRSRPDQVQPVRANNKKSKRRDSYRKLVGKKPPRQAVSLRAPWIFISRYTFLYHYFPAMIFLILSICYVFKNILEYVPEQKWKVYAFTGVSAGIFFLLFPITSGLQMPDWYAAWFVKWLPYWPL